MVPLEFRDQFLNWTKDRAAHQHGGGISKFWLTKQERGARLAIIGI